jgi:hypothetical protein
MKMVSPGVVSSILPCILLSGAVGFCVYLFIAVKREIWLMEKGWKRHAQGLREEADRLREQLELLGKGFQETEERTGLLVAPAPSVSGLNLSKRTQALRMSRRGEAPQQIAGALGLPRHEVELLMKVHRLVVEQP